MKRASLAVVMVVALGVLATAQFNPRRVDPRIDPNAFTTNTQANLDDAMARIARLKGRLAETAEDKERAFLIESILEICQLQLNEDRYDSSVLVAERRDFILPETSTRPDESVYNLPVRWQGAFSTLERIIRDLDEEGLKQYEAVYGPRAESLLKDALNAGDFERVRLLNRRFGLTRAGIRAGEILAARDFESGEISRAARMLERLLDLRELTSVQQRVLYSAWVSHCYRDLGERANMAVLIRETVTLREHEVDLGGKRLKLGALLEQRMLETRDASNEVLARAGIEWPGGNYANTGMHEAPSDYSRAAWTKTLPQLGAWQLGMRFMGYPYPLTPPHLPVFDGSRFYINTGDALAAYDLIDNGRPEPARFVRPFTVTNRNWRLSEPDPNLILPVSVWHGTVFAALENPLHDDFHSRNPDPSFGLWSHFPKVRRAMCAIDGATGRELWRIGGMYEGRGDQATNFLSGVVHDGVLYAVATRLPGRAEIWLYALNPHNGDVLWNLRLCDGQQETTMFGRAAREPHPSLPAIAAGNLYLCTNLGGVVCVDLAGRSLKWISRYDYMPRPSAKYIETYYRDITWFNNPTMYAEHGGRSWIVVAPTDSRKLTAIDARTGEIVWEHRQEFQSISGGRALVGIRDGKVYVASDGGIQGGSAARLHAVNLLNGAVTSDLRVTPADRATTLSLAGRPTMFAGRLLWPGVEAGRNIQVLSEIDLDSMRVVKSYNVPGSWQGYSVFAQHGVVFTLSGREYNRGYNQISVRFNERALLDQARADYTARPQDADAAVRFGLLSMRIGSKPEGLAALDKAFTLASQAPVDVQTRTRAGQALVTNYLEFAEKSASGRNFAEALTHVESARRYAITRAQRTECFVREEAVLLAQGTSRSIDDLYTRMINEDPDFGVGTAPEIPVAYYARIRYAERLAGAGNASEAAALYQQVQEAPSRLSFEGIPLRVLAISKLRALVAAHGRACYQTQDTAADVLLAVGSLEAWRSILRLYPLATAADKAALELAHARLKAGAAEDAVEIVRSALAENPQRPRLAELQVMNALCLRASGELLRARLQAARLIREHPTGTLRVANTERSFRDVLTPLLDADDSESARSALPRLPAQIANNWTRPWDSDGVVRLPVQAPIQPVPRFYVSEVGGGGISIQSLDAQSGKPDWSHRVPVSLMGVHRVRGGTLLVLAQGLALYDDTGGEIWTTGRRGTPDPVNIKAGMVVYGTRSYNTQTQTSLVTISALDADRGTTVWETPMEASSTLWIEQAAHGVLALTQGNHATLHLLDAETGRSMASRTLDNMSRITVPPVLIGDEIITVDRDGKAFIFDAVTLNEKRTYDSKVRLPSMLHAAETDHVIVGQNSVARHDGKTGGVQWRRDFAGGEFVMDRRVSGDNICVTVRGAGFSARVLFISLADGREVSAYNVPRAGETDRVEVRQSGVFDGGIVLAFADRRMREGRMELWGFRLVVIDADGTERFSWQFEATTTQESVQLAVIDNHIALTCSNRTFGFGPRE